MPSVFPQTFEQEAIWIADRFLGQPSPFLETWAQRITGPLDVPALERALAALVARHAAFRTRFRLDDSGPVQDIDPDGTLVLERLPWPGGDLHDVLHRAGQRPLDVAEGPARLTLYELAPDEHVLLVQVHHIAVDDASLVLIDEELSALYAEQIGVATKALPPLPDSTLGEYAVRRRASGVDPEDQAFWAEYLDGARPLNRLPPGPRPLPERRGSECATVRGTITPELGGALRARARSLRNTPTVLMTAGMASTAAAVNGEDLVIVIGTPVSRRGDPELDGVIGCLTDLLPLRCQVPAESTLGEVCLGVKRSSLAVLRHRNMPYAKLGGGVARTRRVLSGEHLGRICFGLDEAPGRLVLPGLHCERVYVGGASAKFDWLQYVVADGKGWSVRADYPTAYFTAEEAETTLRQWQTALAAVAADADQPVRALLDRLAGIGRAAAVDQTRPAEG
ncbi:condensation domain-containing protein [Actinosynnema sp. NPDC023658]|uniref:condensation domain-containing protein n=1 Tax=Actinosynnema sp. NPDC023658 TaxID=3155465 RepID=UPI00340836A9